APPATQGELPPGDAAAARGWFEAQGLGAERAPAGREALAVSPPASLFSPGGGDGEEAPAARAKRRVDGMLAEMRARDLARYPDASWMDLRDALAGGFAPDFGVLRGGGQGTRDLLADTAGAYLGAAEAYGRSGRPFENGPDAPGRVAPGTDATVHAAAEGDRERESLVAGIDALAATGGKGLAWSKALVTVVAVTEDGDGVVTEARVVASSGNPAHDRLALAQARGLIGRSPSRRLAGTTTEWAFVTELSVIPPVPVAGVAFDANFKPKGFVYPLKRKAKSRIELVAVREGG
ncbi:TonB C-terminal domain-containing protein, partial [Anaeromyxobacter sp. SG17]|uniref:TonB C-terminal domain-containing protein n=1 Tax=Anaeromyxobacter sp. SG17 TaxID=2925405 RepID=UPI001F585B40